MLISLGIYEFGRVLWFVVFFYVWCVVMLMIYGREERCREKICFFLFIYKFLVVFSLGF